ncbi:homocysteine S-methyltransferase family protein [Microbacterium hominis]|uniref:homocysteine S-methyltransferase family protein n=1 Tax=Microbacterium TaxID=33882 RepID=UPI00168B0ED1|nr:MULTISPECIES: homocysteine S-methyltransferase family protein [Microbacterium]QOC24519.1 homocysteine S-methyltransferase family protein [Microbacterium hominis]QOC28591.1 homocysteine S-methyltransferase family protein [Microbacterium hominis]QYF99182.1 homocysteine S-methyltransferase family protein [Microbacterium sp. PAMC21962]
MTASLAAARFALDIDGVPRPARAQALLDALAERVVIADGAMGTMLQRHDLRIDTDFAGLEGCNEILNVTRPDVVADIHDAYFAVGVDAVETNTFGANWSNLSDYGIDDRITELAAAGARIARERAEAAEAVDRRMRWVLGSMGPGTKLPSLGHTTYAHLKETFALQAEGLIDGGADAFLVETSQDLLQTKAAINGCKQAIVARGIRLPIFVEVTVETTGTMLMGSEIGAALTALEPLGVDAIGLNCATGPAEMSEHLRHLSKHSSVTIACMPNAGLPVLTADGAHYPLTPAELATAHEQFVREFGLGLIGGCCGTTPEHLAAVVERVGSLPVTSRRIVDGLPGDAATEYTALASRSRTTLVGAAPLAVDREPGVASLYQHVPFRQDASYLAIGERTNANGSKAFREAMLEGRWDDCVEIARGQIRVGAHLLDVCVDYVGRDGVDDIREVVSRFASASTLPLVIDSTEPAVIQAGLELIGGRPVVNSVNYEDGDGAASRFGRIMPLVKEHGTAVIALTIDEQGQARTAEDKLRIASRLVDELVGAWGMWVEDIIVDCLTFPIATGQEETRRDAIETIEAIRGLVAKYPGINTTLGVSNVSFGLNPAARSVLNSVFLHEATQAGLTSGIIDAAKIVPLASLPEEQRKVALDLVWDRREWDADGTLTYDPLATMLDLFAGVDTAALRDQRAAELAALPVGERLERRIIDGELKGLEADLDLARAGDADAAPLSPLQIINDHLLEGMKVVGERFGSGQMQLPFVLQSAEVMKTAVALLEPHMEKTDEAGKGTIVLATVRGDVHDIGKNLVDIILTNNGYTVINLGIKQPIADIIAAAEEHGADVIGMSGLLVKSTVVMKENLQELSARGLGTRWPVILGGAALTRAYVEQDLAELFDGEVRYAKDAFEGLALMEPLVRIARGEAPDAVGLPPLKKRIHAAGSRLTLTEPEAMPARSDVASDNPVPAPPFWGTRIVRGIALADYAAFLDERATFMGQWGLKPGRGEDGLSYEQLVDTEGRPRLRYWLDRILAERMLDASVAYGYFPVVSEGDDLVVLHHGDDPTGLLGPAGLLAPDGGSGGALGSDRLRFHFPRQRRDRHLNLADFVRSRASGQVDVLPVQLVTAGAAIDAVTAKMFAEDRYRDYYELNGLVMQLTEALAEFWHARIRAELGFAGEDPADTAGLFKLDYRGARFSLGYPACPDMEDRRKVVELLRPERMGVELSEELQLHPEQSTDAFVFHHPEAKYFSV